MNTAPVASCACPRAGLEPLADEVLCLRVARLREEMLTVCAWTHRIKYEGEWIAPDLFLHRFLQVPITHGIAPDVADLLLAADHDDVDDPAHPEAREPRP